jgi:glutamine synthetase
VKNTVSAHKRIVFNGNNYSDEWVVEAKNRGLSNLKTTVDALPAFISEKAITLFTQHHVFSEIEMRSRYEILMEGYCKTINIEALAMLDITKGLIIPACVDYQNDLSKLLTKKKSLGIPASKMESSLLEKFSLLSDCLWDKVEALDSALANPSSDHDVLTHAMFYRNTVFAAMNELRLVADQLETYAADKYWPLPSYGDLLYKV